MRPCPHLAAPKLLSITTLALALALAAPVARAAWIPDGVPLSPAPPDFNTRYWLQGLLADGAGGAYATWRREESFPFSDDSNYSLAVQRVDLFGNRPAPWAPGGSVLISWIYGPSGTSPTWAEPVGLVPDAAGGAVHAIARSSAAVEPHTNFNLRHVAPNASTAGVPLYDGDFQGDAIFGAAVDADGAGGVVAILHGETFSPPPGPDPPAPTYAKRVDAAGNTSWGPVEVTTAGNGAGGLSALFDGTGGGYFAWIDVRNGNRDVFVQHLDATGAIAAGWPAGGLAVCASPGDQFETRLAPDGAGGVFVVWRDERSGTPRLFGSHVLASGAIAGGIPTFGAPIPSADLDDAFVNLAADGQGGLYLVRAGLTPALVGISYLHRLDGDLLPRAGWPANGQALNTQSPSHGAVGLAADDAGGAFVSYRNGFGSTHPQGLYAQHFAFDGTLAPGWTAGGYRLSGTGGASRLVRSGSGAIVAWDDSRASHRGVYAQRLVVDGPVAAQLSLVSADLREGRVALHWYAADAAGLVASIERRDETTDWAALGEITGDGTGNLRYEDALVAAGSRVAYRLSWNDAGTLRRTDAVWVSVPQAARLALAAPRPNPSTGAVSLAIALEGGTPATLDVIDLAGRRVTGREWASPAAGAREVALDEAAGFAPGVYVIRLRQAGASRTVRLVRMP